MNVKADGSTERRIYEFHGCFWHSCPMHHPARGEDVVNRYERTVRLTALFRKSGYTVVEKWECKWKREREEDSEVVAYHLQAHASTHAPRRFVWRTDECDALVPPGELAARRDHQDGGCRVRVLQRVSPRSIPCRTP
jgi:hypothetical protein